jgi:hypothetical protein
LQIHGINRCGQTTRGSPPGWAWGYKHLTVKSKHLMEKSDEPWTWTDSVYKGPKRRNMGWSDVDWIGLAQDRERWRALVNAIMNLRVP